MPQDIVPELLEAVERSFRENLQNNNRISELRKALEAGTATYSEADMYAVEVGQALAKAFHDNVSSSGLPDGKMYYNIASRVIPPPLRTSYEDIAEYAKAMQRGMNERARLGIKAQSAAYNEDREKGLIERACGADQYDDIRKSFEEDLVNFDQAVVTDTLHANAEFQYQAGLSPVIRRIANGGCCGWCAKLAGTYPYEDVRDTGNDVYCRHRACRCKVTFDPGDGKVQDVHTKRWEQRQIILQTDVRNGIKATPYSERGIAIPPEIQRMIQHTTKPGSYYEIIGKELSDNHLRILTIETGHEYAKLRCGDSTIVLRGTEKGVVIPDRIVERMKNEGGELSVHCHPYVGDLIPSGDDLKTIRTLKKIVGQESSTILSPDGRLAIFNETGIIEVKGESSLLTSEEKARLRRLFGE